MLDLVLAGALAASVASGALLAYWLHGSHGENTLIRGMLDASRRAYDDLESRRDDLVVRLTAATARERTAVERLAVAELQRNEAFRKARADVIEEIRRSDIEHAGAVVTELLGRPLLAVRGGSAPGADASNR